jgi:hypothetical protein
MKIMGKGEEEREWEENESAPELPSSESLRNLPDFLIRRGDENSPPEGALGVEREPGRMPGLVK